MYYKMVKIHLSNQDLFAEFFLFSKKTFVLGTH